MSLSEGTPPINLSSYSMNRNVERHMSSSNNSSPPSDFGDLSITDSGSVMPALTRSMTASDRLIYSARGLAAAPRRSVGNRNSMRDDSDEDASSSEGDERQDSGEEGDSRATALAQKKEIFQRMVVFHPKQYGPTEHTPDSNGGHGTDAASYYRKLTELVALCAVSNQNVWQGVRLAIPDAFWGQQMVANQRLRFDRIKLGLDRRIARLPDGRGIPETIGQLQKLYHAIDTLLRHPIIVNSRELVSTLVEVLVDALDYMVNDEDLFPNATTRPTFVGSSFQSERRLAGAFLAQGARPIGFITALITVRRRYPAAYLTQSARLQEIYNRLGLICVEYTTRRSVPANEQEHFRNVLRVYRSGLLPA